MVTVPTPAQARAGNYKKIHLRVHGLDIAIENMAGSVRRGVDPEGKPWAVVMPYHYGYVKGTKGADGDQLDVAIGPTPQSLEAHIINQTDPDGDFDEHKVFLGYPSREAAIEAFKAGRNDDPHRVLGEVITVSVDELKRWIAEGCLKEEAVLKAATSHVKGHYRTVNGKVTYIADYTKEVHGDHPEAALHERTVKGQLGDGHHFIRATDAEDLKHLQDKADALGIKHFHHEKRGKYIKGNHHGRVSTYPTMLFHSEEDAQKVYASIHPEATAQAAPVEPTPATKPAITPEEAHTMGAAAFQAGLPMAPVLNQDFYSAHVEPLIASGGSATGIVQAYVAGWTAANMAAPVAGQEGEAVDQPLLDAGFTKVNPYTYAKKVQTGEHTFVTVNIKHAGTPKKWHTSASATFTNGVTGAPSASLGAYDTPGQALTAAKGVMGEHVNVGDTKVVDGKTYLFNANHRWELQEEPAATPAAEGGQTVDLKDCLSPKGSITAASLKGDNAIWKTYKDAFTLVADAKVTFMGQAPSESAKKEHAIYEAAKAAGFGFIYHPSTGSQGIRILIKDGKVLTQKGAEALLGAEPTPTPTPTPTPAPAPAPAAPLAPVSIEHDQAKVDALLELGKLWEKEGKKRIYFNGLAGLYNEANGTDKSYGDLFKGSKVWYDFADGDFHGKNLSPADTKILIDHIKAKAEGIIQDKANPPLAPVGPDKGPEVDKKGEAQADAMVDLQSKLAPEALADALKGKVFSQALDHFQKLKNEAPNQEAVDKVLSAKGAFVAVTSPGLKYVTNSALSNKKTAPIADIILAAAKGVMGVDDIQTIVDFAVKANQLANITETPKDHESATTLGMATGKLKSISDDEIDNIVALIKHGGASEGTAVGIASGIKAMRQMGVDAANDFHGKAYNILDALAASKKESVATHGYQKGTKFNIHTEGKALLMLRHFYDAHGDKAAVEILDDQIEDAKNAHAAAQKVEHYIEADHQAIADHAATLSGPARAAQYKLAAVSAATKAKAEDAKANPDPSASAALWAAAKTYAAKAQE